MRAPPSKLVRVATVRRAQANIAKLQRQAHSIMLGLPQSLREAAKRNSERNKNARARSRTAKGQSEARQKADRATVLRRARARVTNAEIAAFKKLLNNTAGHNFKFHNVASLNRAWKNFEGTSGFVTQKRLDPYSGLSKYNIPPTAENRYQRIRKQYLANAQRAALNAQRQAINAERQRVNAYMAHLHGLGGSVNSALRHVRR
jgi:hypothetical protein